MVCSDWRTSDHHQLWWRRVPSDAHQRARLGHLDHHWPDRDPVGRPDPFDPDRAARAMGDQGAHLPRPGRRVARRAHDGRGEEVGRRDPKDDRQPPDVLDDPRRTLARVFDHSQIENSSIARGQHFADSPQSVIQLFLGIVCAYTHEERLDDGFSVFFLAVAMVPSLVLGSVGGGWRPEGSLNDPAAHDPSASSMHLYENGQGQMVSYFFFFFFHRALSSSIAHFDLLALSLGHVPSRESLALGFDDETARNDRARPGASALSTHRETSSLKRKKEKTQSPLFHRSLKGNGLFLVSKYRLSSLHRLHEANHPTILFCTTLFPFFFFVSLTLQLSWSRKPPPISSRSNQLQTFVTTIHNRLSLSLDRRNNRKPCYQLFSSFLLEPSRVPRVRQRRVELGADRARRGVLRNEGAEREPKRAPLFLSLSLFFPLTPRATHNRENHAQ